MRALIVTYNNFPDGDAGAVRQAVFGKIMLNMGYHVSLIGMGPCTHGESRSFNGIEYVSFRNAKNHLLAKLSNFFGYASKFQNYLIQNERFDLLLVIDLPLKAMHVAQEYACKQNIPLIHDSVEWYSPEQFAKGKWAAEYIRKDYKNRFFLKKPWRVVAISQYLEAHFANKGMRTARIPVILDIANTSCNKRCQPDKTVILYAGVMGKRSSGVKDNFDFLVEALRRLEDAERSKLEIRILGSTETQLREAVEMDNATWEQIKDIIVCKGRVPRNVVIENLAEADFTVLLRDGNLRYTKAGFPTKVVESLASATPIICNLTSDLALYLSDEENALIVKEYSVEAVLEAMRRAISLSSQRRKEMQLCARDTAKKHFDFSLYIEKLKQLSQ